MTTGTLDRYPVLGLLSGVSATWQSLFMAPGIRVLLVSMNLQYKQIHGGQTQTNMEIKISYWLLTNLAGMIRKVPLNANPVIQLIF